MRPGRFGLRMLAPPFGPSDFVGGARGLHDDPLVGRAKCPIEACQRGLNEPGFEDDPYGLAVAIEFPGHSQRLQRRCDTAGLYKIQGYGPDLGLASAMPLPGLLDQSQGRTGSGAIAFHPAFSEFQQKSLGRRDTALASAFADGHNLAEYGLIGRFAITPPRTTRRIATPTFCKARRPWRLAITDAIVLGTVRRFPPGSHLSVPRGQRRLSGSRVQRRISSRSLSVRRWPPRLRRSAACTAQGSSRRCARSLRQPARSGLCAAIPRRRRAVSALSESYEKLNARSEALGSCSASH